MTKSMGTLVCSNPHHTLRPKFIHTTVVYEDAEGNLKNSCAIRDQWTCAYCGEVVETQVTEPRVYEERRSRVAEGGWTVLLQDNGEPYPISCPACPENSGYYNPVDHKWTCAKCKRVLRTQAVCCMPPTEEEEMQAAMMPDKGRTGGPTFPICEVCGNERTLENDDE